LSGLLRRALLATAGLYVVQGVPFVLWIIAMGAYQPSSGGEDLFTLIPFWTGSAYILGVILFGASLIVGSLLTSFRAWSRLLALVTVAVALVAYTAPPIVAAVIDSNSTEYAIDNAQFVFFFTWCPFFGGWVALAGALLWAWRSDLALRKETAGHPALSRLDSASSR
jgi:hypothetical protein